MSQQCFYHLQKPSNDRYLTEKQVPTVVLRRVGINQSIDQSIKTKWLQWRKTEDVSGTLYTDAEATLSGTYTDAIRSDPIRSDWQSRRCALTVSSVGHNRRKSLKS